MNHVRSFKGLVPVSFPFLVGNLRLIRPGGTG